MSDQPAPITDEELDALRNAFTHAPQGRTMSLIARIDLERNRADRLRELLNNVPLRDESGHCFHCGCHWNSNGGHYDFCEFPVSDQGETDA